MGVFAYVSVELPENPGISDFAMLPFIQQFITHFLRIDNMAYIVLGTENKMKSSSTVVGEQDNM